MATAIQFEKPRAGSQSAASSQLLTVEEVAELLNLPADLNRGPADYEMDAFPLSPCFSITASSPHSAYFGVVLVLVCNAVCNGRMVVVESTITASMSHCHQSGVL
jgi:hypothetical protein